jgi:hypothetical protein
MKVRAFPPKRIVNVTMATAAIQFTVLDPVGIANTLPVCVRITLTTTFIEFLQLRQH